MDEVALLPVSPILHFLSVEKTVWGIPWIDIMSGVMFGLIIFRVGYSSHSKILFRMCWLKHMSDLNEFGWMYISDEWV